MFAKEAQDSSYVCVLPDRTVKDVVAELRGMENVYSRNVAALKWRLTEDGERVYERASYAYVPDGFFGKRQYHLRLWPHRDGVAVWAHYELNPWVRPASHYDGVGWEEGAGAELVHEHFDVDETKSKNAVTKP